MATPVTVKGTLHSVGASLATPLTNPNQHSTSSLDYNVQFNDATAISTTDSTYAADVTTYVQNQIYPIIQQQYNAGAREINLKVEIKADSDVRQDGSYAKEAYFVQIAVSKITQPADIIALVNAAIARALSIDSNASVGAGF